MAIGLSTSCVFPSGIETAFKIASEVGYDGVEVMISKQKETRDANKIIELSQRYNLPVLSIHAPVLVLTSFVFGIGAKEKLKRTVKLAEQVGADTVVVHPPYFFQTAFGKEFEHFVNDLQQSTHVFISVENMFNLRAWGKELPTFLPGWNPGDIDIPNATLDFSHCASQGVNSLELAKEWGSKTKHIHLCDGNTGSIQDDHLVPGKGDQPVKETLEFLKDSNFNGHIIAEIHTESFSKSKRKKKIENTLKFARKHFNQ
jgi:sugar phosphate isomerase/epimerase